MSAENVWALLLEGHDDAVDLVENLAAAAIGADADPTILTEQTGKCADYIFGGTDEEIGRRVINLAAAFAGIARGLTSSFASFVVEVMEEDGEAAPDDRRNAELHFLSVSVQSLRGTIAGDAGD